MRKNPVEQIVFEVNAMLLQANFAFVMTGDLKQMESARRGIENAIGPPAKQRPAPVRHSTRKR